MTAPRLQRSPHPRSGFSLLECVVVVLLLAIAIPTTAMFLDQRAAQRADAVQALRASTLAQGVLEHVLADAASNAPGRGYGAFANATTYLNAPVGGLYQRLAPMLDFYQQFGIAAEVTISTPVSATGIATGVPAADLFRVVTVRVTAASATASPIDVSVSSLVTDL
jgi:prepilin-type N-terminal cleavage/methylation domain-containing protein